MRRNKGKFSKKQFYYLPNSWNGNLKIWLPFIYAFIIAFTGTYISEAKAFHNNYIKPIYGKTKITVYPNVPPYKEVREECHQDESSLPEILNSGNAIEDKIRRVAEEEKFDEVDMLLRIARCESSMNPNAINVNRDGSVDSGLFQINEYWHGADRDCHTDVTCATRKAIQIQRKAGWSAWVCYWKYNL